METKTDIAKFISFLVKFFHFVSDNGIKIFPLRIFPFATRWQILFRMVKQFYLRMQE